MAKTQVVGTEKAKIAELGSRQYWLNEIRASMKREKDYRAKTQKEVDIYEGGQCNLASFNILYSNTETLNPALYNSTPRPVVRRRFKDPDPMGLVASKVTQRLIEFLLDPGDQEYSTFDDCMGNAVLSGTVAGRGVTWVKYDPKFAAGADGATEEVKYEIVCLEEVPWDRFLMGYAQVWSKVPWVAREHLMTADELEKNFGRESAEKFQLVSPVSRSGDEDAAGSRKEEVDTGMTEVAFVYEIWDKLQKKVIFVSPQYEEEIPKEIEDPLKLTGFFPCAQPLVFVEKLSNMVPVTLYTMYREQSEELNRITKRLKYLIQALKVRGFYDATIQDIEDMMKSEDNTLLPAAGLQGLEGRTLDSAIWLMPIDKIVAVVQSLYLQREQVKQVIYEITGIADIMRGSTNAVETAEAQSIKSSWGTLRMKKLQKKVMKYTRDNMRIIAEIAVTQFSEETCRAMTGLPFPTKVEKAQAQAMLQSPQVQMAMQQAQQAQQGMQQAGPGQAPQALPIPPGMMQQIQQAQMTAALPSWAEILGVLRDDQLRSYKIDIETNSTIDLDATEDKKEIGEFLNALAQLLNGIQPAVESGMFTADVAKKLVMTILRRFRFTDEVEEDLEQAGGKQQQQQDPKAAAEAAKAQAEMQQTQMDSQIAQEKAKLDQQEIAARAQKLAMTAQYEQQEHQMKMAELAQKMQLAEAKHTAAMAQAAQKAQQARQQPKQPGAQ